MGAKRRQMESGRTGSVSVEVLNRYAVKDPIGFHELRDQQERSAQASLNRREKRRKAERMDDLQEAA